MAEPDIIALSKQSCRTSLSKLLRIGDGATVVDTVENFRRENLLPLEKLNKLTTIAAPGPQLPTSAPHTTGVLPLSPLPSSPDPMSTTHDPTAPTAVTKGVGGEDIAKMHEMLATMAQHVIQLGQENGKWQEQVKQLTVDKAELAERVKELEAEKTELEGQVKELREKLEQGSERKRAWDMKDGESLSVKKRSGSDGKAYKIIKTAFGEIRKPSS